MQEGRDTVVQRLGSAVGDEVGRVIVGKADQTRLVTVALLTGGHVLIDDVPGVAKTLLVRTFAAALGLSFRRIQCTADLLPADVTGSTVFDERGREFVFRPGPLFADVVLADEINRATPRTQSAFLEAMQEGSVTVDGTTHPLPQPFMVLATQNPVEQKGTFPLPEAQLDRFLLRIRMGYPSAADEVEILRRFRAVDPLDEVRPVDVAGELPAAQQEVRDVYVADDVAQYVVALATATREAPGLRLGASPRASLALLHAAQAWAALDGRPFVTPDDVQSLAVPVLAHRVLLSRDAAFAQRDAEAVLREIVAEVPVPAEQGETLSAR
ncbi:MAG TPA: MoxR family ATPase [Thermoleophilia bacterium]|nr:MoxR family ATPase [Thermoleophilia bacterium]HQG02835.1 MoxR family ATPase [Thermoleophilia bacterium]